VVKHRFQPLEAPRDPLKLSKQREVESALIFGDRPDIPCDRSADDALGVNRDWAQHGPQGLNGPHGIEIGKLVKRRCLLRAPKLGLKPCEQFLGVLTCGTLPGHFGLDFGD
jgi:hypothetical protein